MSKRQRIWVAAVGALVLWGIGCYIAGSIVGVETDGGLVTGVLGGMWVLGLAYAVLVIVALLFAIMFRVFNWIDRGVDHV